MSIRRIVFAFRGRVDVFLIRFSGVYVFLMADSPRVLMSASIDPLLYAFNGIYRRLNYGIICTYMSYPAGLQHLLCVFNIIMAKQSY